jgi:hypothetical protein
MSSPTITVFGPDVQIRGMNSSQDPTAISPSMLSYLTNVRTSRAALTVRNPHVELVSSADLNASAAFKGSWTGTVGSGAVLYAAFRWGGATRLFFSNSFTAGSWTEFSTASPDTRFATDGNVGFAVVSAINPVDDSRKSLVVIGNGADDCRVYDPVAGTIGIQAAITAPTWVNQTSRPNGYMNFTGGTTDYKYQSTSSKFSATYSLVNGVELTVDTTASTQETVALLWGAQSQLGALGAVDSLTNGFTLQNEFGVLTRTTTASPITTDPTAVLINDVWEQLTTVRLLSFSAAGVAVTGATNATPIVITTTTAHGLTTGNYVSVQGVTGNLAANGVAPVTVLTPTTYQLNGTIGSGAYVAGGTSRKLDPTTIYDALTRPTLPRKLQAPAVNNGRNAQFVVYDTTDIAGLTGVVGLLMTTTGTAPAADVTSQFLSVCTTGKVFGDASYAVSYYNATSYGESVATVARVVPASFPVYHITADAQNYLFDFGGNTYSAFRITFPDQTSGVQALFYRSDNEITPEGGTAYSPYYYLGATEGQLALGSFSPFFAAKNTEVINRTFLREARDVGSVVIPKGNLFTAANGRLFVAGLSATALQNQLWISKYNSPFNFNATAEVDDFGNVKTSSPILNIYAGEKVTALRRMTGEIIGVDSVLAWTDKGLYRVRGFDARSLSQTGRVSNMGTFYERTVSVFGSRIYYLSTDRQIVKTVAGSGENAVSYSVVDNIIEASSLTNPCGSASDYQYGMWFDGSSDSGLNKRGLIYTESIDGFVLDTFSATNLNLAFVAAIDTTPGRLTLGITDKGRVWQLEKTPVPATPSTYLEGGAGLAVEAWSKELYNNLWERIRFGRVGFVCDNKDGSGTTINTTLTTVRYSSFDQTNNGGGASTRINLASSTLGAGSAYRWDSDASGNNVGIGAFSCIVKVSGAFPAGVRLRKLVIEVGQKTKGADVA